MSDLHWHVETKHEFCHYGVKGMKWGVRRTPEQLGHRASSKRAKSLSDKMKKEIAYDEYRGLKDHTDVQKSKKGDCHSQVMYEYEELKKIGVSPKAKFFIEVDPSNGQGGTTHSFVYFKDGESTVWFENAWGGREGLHRYLSEKEMIADIEKMHRFEQRDDRKKYSEIVWGDFIPEHHHKGESLQELLDIVLKDSR